MSVIIVQLHTVQNETCLTPFIPLWTVQFWKCCFELKSVLEYNSCVCPSILTDKVNWNVSVHESVLTYSGNNGKVINVNSIEK